MQQKTSTEFWKQTFKVPISGQTIPDSDTLALSEWLKSCPRLTEGEQVHKFEKMLAEYLGKKHAVMVNSGSSANLLALSVYKKMFAKNNKVVLPALSWATDISPILQLGMEPIFVDCETGTLHMDPVKLEDVLSEQSPSCVLFVDILGIASMVPQKVKELCWNYGTFMIEDCCESLGTVHNGVNAGTYGQISTFSFYYSHQISSIEGGALATDNDDIYDMLVSMRSHGWARKTLRMYGRVKTKYKLDDFEMQFAFVNPGYNLRSTDLNAFIGVRQLMRIEEVATKRHINYSVLKDIFKELSLWVPMEPCSVTDIICALAYPVITTDRKKAVELLTSHGIETRPIIAGNILRQPLMDSNSTGFDVSDKIHANGLYLPVHPDITTKQLELIETVISANKYLFDEEL